MAEVLGLSTLLRLALPTGADATKLAKWTLREGYSYADWVAETAAGLAAFNAEITTKWGWLTHLYDESPLVEYPDGGSVTEAAEITDADTPEPRHGTTIGHMIDLRVYGDAVGGSRRFFRDAREAQLNSDVRRIVLSLRWRFEKKLLNRWFTNSESSVGSSGYNVPFVRGTGGNVDFTPPAFDGESFTTAHDHYLGVNTASYGYGDALNQLAETLQEHGHEPPFVALVSRANISSYYALEHFVRPLQQNVVFIDRGGDTSGPSFYSRDEREFGLIGGFESEYGYIELRATNRVPTTYLGMVKSYGNDDPRNPLYVRVHPDEGFGARIVPETADDPSYPLKKLIAEMEFDVGVGMDRTVGAAAYLVSGGVWSNPTIT